MDALEILNLDSIKRYWRRKKYKRLDDATKSKRKLKIARLGSRNQRYSNAKLSHKLRIRIISPVKIFTKCHRFYIDALIRLVGYKKNKNGLIEENKVLKTKTRPFAMVSTGTNEIVDGRLVVEIYQRILSSRESPALFV